MQALPADESLPRFPTRTMLLSRYPMAIYVRPLFCWLLVALGGGAVWSVSARAADAPSDAAQALNECLADLNSRSIRNPWAWRGEATNSRQG